VKLWYKVEGKTQPGRAPLLFLHGGPGYNSYSFEKTIGPQLQAHVQMIYLDERGSGRSERPANRDYSMSTLVQDVNALRETLGVPKLSLMGHSFGGTIALEYAARYPQFVEKLIIMDGAADMPAILSLWRAEIEHRYPAAWRSALDGPAGDTLKQAGKTGDSCSLAKAQFSAEMASLQSVDSQAFHDWQQFHDPHYLQQQKALDQESGLQNTGELSKAYVSSDSEFPCYRFTAYKRLTMPALVMVGKFDGAIGLEQMRALAEHLPDAQLDEFSRSGHFVYAEEPVKFVQDVTHFLNRDH
jgi:proline iminopeptidase